MDKLLQKSILPSRLAHKKEIVLILALVGFFFIILLSVANKRDIEVYANELSDSHENFSAIDSILGTDLFKNISTFSQDLTKSENESKFTSKAYRGPIKVVTIEYPDSQRLEKRIASSLKVGEIIEELQINTDGYKVSPSVDSILLPPYKIILNEYYEETIIKREPISFVRQQIINKNLDIDTTRKLQNGVNGELSITYLDVYENRKLVSSTEISREVTTQPIADITEIGKKPRKITINGDTFTYCKRVRVWATHYDKNCYGCNDRTALGTKLQKGTVAVDPKIFPYKTQMYIPGYGFGKALDTGGGILGYKDGVPKIDLGFYDYRLDPIGWRTGFTDIYILCK